MPSTAASAGCKRRMISDVSDLRSSRGFRLIWRRPLFGVMLVPSTPMNDDRLATSGSFRMIRASACWRSAIVRNETMAERLQAVARIILISDEHTSELQSRQYLVSSVTLVQELTFG